MLAQSPGLRHSTRNTQHTALISQHSELSTQHSALRTQNDTVACDSQQLVIESALSMNDRAGSNQRLIVSHSVLAGLTPLIPLPIVDDLARVYFVRRLVRKLAAANGYKIGEVDVKILADEPGSGCLQGCAIATLLLPFKLIFRKVFFFLEWKRAVDTASHVYYQGYLVDCSLGEGWCAPVGQRSFFEVRAAIDTVLGRLNTSLIERAIRGTFYQSKSTLKSAAAILARGLRRTPRTASPEEVGEAVEVVAEQEGKEIAGITERLLGAISAIPSGHFRRLRNDLAAQLGTTTRTLEEDIPR